MSPLPPVFAIGARRGRGEQPLPPPTTRPSPLREGRGLLRPTRVVIMTLAQARKEYPRSPPTSRRRQDQADPTADARAYGPAQARKEAHPPPAL
eukprot:gene5795-3845_t